MSAVMVRDALSDDRALVTAARHGDRAAREALGRRVGRSAYVFALQLTGDREAARELSLPQGTVMSRLHAARTSLRDLLAAERAADHGADDDRGGI